jgi:hypothetical protein
MADALKAKEKEKHPLWDELHKIGIDPVKLLLETHAGTAMVVAALMDNYLQMGLRLKMPGLQNDNDLEGRLFKGTGPLRDAGPKIDLAKALGVITEQMYKDAHVVRKIRNEFAHASGAIHFHTDKVRGLATKLSTYFDAEQNEQSAYLKAVDSITKHVTEGIADEAEARRATKKD